MSTSSEIRARARQNLGGGIFQNAWLNALVACLVVALLSSLINIVPGVGTVASIIITGPLTVGLNKYFIMLSRKQEVKISNVFDSFKDDLGGSIGTYLLTAVFTILWTLLFIIPGIVKSFSYAMATYIRVDHPEYTATQAITESRKMMDGYKFKYFCLNLSFIGWIFVGALACGIGTLWVTAYISSAKAEFYEELKSKSVAEAELAAEA